MKKLISLFTTLCIVFGVFGAFTVFAEDTDITEISTLAQLEAFRDDVNSGNTYEGKTVRLTADIDMSEKYGEGRESWTPIDTFAGTFDGNNHIISGFYAYTEEEYGFASFFNMVTGTLKNLNVEGVVIGNHPYDCAVAGIARCLGANAQMLNCLFEGTVKNPNYVAGGLVSDNGGLISGCRFKGEVVY